MKEMKKNKSKLPLFESFRILLAVVLIILCLGGYFLDELDNNFIWFVVGYAVILSFAPIGVDIIKWYKNKK